MTELLTFSESIRKAVEMGAEKVIENNYIQNQNEQLFNKKIMRINDVAELLGISTGHIYNLVYQSKGRRVPLIPHHKKGKLLFFLYDEILSWVQEGDLK